MGETIKELQVRFTADTSEFLTGTKKAEGGLSAFAGGVVVVANQFTELVSKVVRGAQQIARAILDVTKVFAEFEKGMAEAFTLISATDAQVASLTSGMQDLSGQFGTAQADQVSALYNALSAGAADADSAVQFLTVANKAAIAGVTDVNSAVLALSSTINAYGLTADDATKVSDIFFTAVKEGVLTFSDLATGVGRVAGIAAQAGIPLEELTAALATLTKGGISFDEAVTSVRQVIVSFLTPTEQASAAADKLKIEFSGAHLKAVGLGRALKEVRVALLKMEEKGEDTSTVVSDLFTSVRAFAGAALLAGGQSEEFARIIEASLGPAAGATERAFQKMAKTLSFVLDRVSAALKNLAIDFGKEFAPVVRDVAEDLLDVIQTLRILVPLIKDVGREVKRTAEAAPLLGDLITIVKIALGPITAAARETLDALEEARKAEEALQKMRERVAAPERVAKAAAEEKRRRLAGLKEEERSFISFLEDRLKKELVIVKKGTDGFVKEWQKRIAFARNGLQQLLSAQRSALEQIKNLQNKRRLFTESVEDTIRGIELTGLDEVLRFHTQVALARSEAELARGALEKSNFAEALRLADRARSAFASLAGTRIEKDGEIIVSAEESRRIAIEGLEEIQATGQRAYSGMENVASTKLQSIQESIRSVVDEIKHLRQEAERVVSELELTVRTDKAKAKIEEFAQFTENRLRAALAFPEGEGGAEGLMRAMRRGQLQPIGGATP